MPVQGVLILKFGGKKLLSVTGSENAFSEMIYSNNIFEQIGPLFIYSIHNIKHIWSFFVGKYTALISFS